jgi:hypothetical protein
MTNPNNTAVTAADYASQGFISRYRARFGANELVNDPMEAAYINVYLICDI